jgi:ribosomal protein S17E
MTKIELEGIVSQKSNLKNLPNATLVEFMDKLTLDFETTKQNLINLTIHLDKVEETYNFILKEYQNRVNE